MRGAARASALAGLLAALLALGCGRNPVLGEWEIDRVDNARGVEYVVEEAVVRVVRGDGRGEHGVEVLADGRIRVELPIGVAAVYRRAG